MTSDAGSGNVPDVAQLVAGMPVAMLVLRPDRTVAMVNPAGESLFEQGARRIIDQPLNDLVQFDEGRVGEELAQSDTNFAAHRMRARIGRDLVKTVDITVSTLGGLEGWQMLIMSESAAGASIFEIENGSEGFAVRGPDVLAHEIKNPLAAIKGAAQLIERSSDEPIKRLTGLIRAEVDRIALLIDQMQSLTSRTHVPATPCIIYEPISRAREVLETAHPGAVRIIEDFDPSIPPVMAASESLVQVLLNLMTNALEALKDVADPQITISTKFVSGVRMRLSNADRYVRLPVEVRITDNAGGIDPNIAEDIFSPFVTSKKGGQGLGLALVQKLVRDMNGRIVHEREEARGLTHFRLFLPLASD